jgi:hypothetical protein
MRRVEEPNNNARGRLQSDIVSFVNKFHSYTLVCPEANRPTKYIRSTSVLLVSKRTYRVKYIHVYGQIKEPARVSLGRPQRARLGGLHM